jgi:phage tail protein X
MDMPHELPNLAFFPGAGAPAGGPEMKIYSEQGETVDAVCWRYYGQTRALVEQVYALNPTLAGHGPVLPHGTALTLPDAAAAPVTESVKLWE